MIQRATRSVSAVFIGAGLAIATFLSRVPQIRDLLKLTPGPLGKVLLMLAIGSLVSLPLAGLVVRNLGTKRTVAIMSLVTVSGVSIAGVGSEVSTVMVGAGLLVAGFGMGQWDVAMNVEAAAVEQRLGRSVMSRFHAAFSVGTVIGALLGAAANKAHVRPAVHLVAVMIVVGLATLLATKDFIGEAPHEVDEARTSGQPTHAWKEPRTILIGLFVLCMTFAEGTGNDWLGVTAIDGYKTSDATGSFAYVVFVTAMTTGRWFGPQILDRFGRVRVLRACALSALSGVALVVLGPVVWVAFLGIVLWGLGASLGFPTGVSAAADDPAHAAARVSAVATIAYVAFLAGPSLIGAIGEHTGVRKALTLTAAVLAVGFVVASSTRPEQGRFVPGSLGMSQSSSPSSPPRQTE